MQRTLRFGWASTAVAIATAAVGAVGTGGCCTMAHTVKPDGLHMRKTEKCDGLAATCPWIVADFLWLIPGIIPGVIALAVDFGTGAWQHDNLTESGTSSTPVAAEPAESIAQR